MSVSTVINLDRLPAPTFIEQPSFEEIFAARKARLIELAPDLAPVLEFESEPLVKLLQEDSYREVILRAAVHSASVGNLLAFASGPVLEHMAAFFGVERQLISPADDNAVPPVPAVYESDERLRSRLQLAPEGFSTAGSVGSYKFWTVSASTDVRDVAVLQTAQPGEVRVVVLSGVGSGVPSAQLLADVTDLLDEKRPLTDIVLVEPAAVHEFSVSAELVLYPGPDAALVRAASEAALLDYVAARHRLGHDVTMAGLYAALYVEGVQDVVIQSPAASIVIGEDTASFCTGVSVTIAGARDV